jgi:putative endonuclease
MPKHNICTGRYGEDKAAVLLKKNGYKIIERNYRNKLGEIDIIARDNGVVCFIEVKARNSGSFGSAAEAVTKTKQGQIVKAALQYIKDKNLFDVDARFDVVTLDCSSSIPKVDIIKDAFEIDES